MEHLDILRFKKLKMYLLNWWFAPNCDNFNTSSSLVSLPSTIWTKLGYLGPSRLISPQEKEHLHLLHGHPLWQTSWPSWSCCWIARACITPPKFNIAPEKRAVGRLLSYRLSGRSLFRGELLNFRGVTSRLQRKVSWSTEGLHAIDSDSPNPAHDEHVCC